MTEPAIIKADDHYKSEAQNQWNQDACGSHYVQGVQPDTLAWYLEAERYRYGTYAPWMHEVMEFGRHRGEKVLEIGAGMGTDLAQYAQNGALCTDLDLSIGHLQHARRNFMLRGLEARFEHGDAEAMPFVDSEFDVVYTNGVIHHTPNTCAVIDELHRVLRPGGKAIVMVYAENSWHYWRRLVSEIGIIKGELWRKSIGDIMSGTVEISTHKQKPLVKVYTAARLRRMFARFAKIDVCKRQLIREEVPKALAHVPLDLLQRLMGWNLIVKAVKR